LSSRVQKADSNQPVTLTGNDSIALQGNVPAWLVKSGALDLFAAETGNVANGRRRFLFRVGENEMLFAPSVHFERALVAVPSGFATALPVTDEALASHPDCVLGIETWFVQIARLLASYPVPEHAVRMPLSGDGRNNATGTAFHWTDPQPGWVRLASGSASIVGRSREMAAGCVFPMVPGLWLSSTCPVALECINPETAARELRFSTVQVLTDLLLRVAAEMEQQQRMQARLRVEQRQQLEQRMTAAAVVELSGMKEQAGSLPEAPLLAAARMVAHSLGLEVHAPVSSNASDHPIAAIAHASGFRTRRVLLTAEWWRRDNGPLLAFTAKDRSPVSLIPRRHATGGFSYELVDPANGSATRLTGENAASLDAAAFSFYRRFDAGFAFIDLARFALRPYKRDLSMVMFASTAAGLLGMAVPAATSVLFGQAIPDVDRNWAWQVILGMAAALLGIGMFSFAQSIAMVRIQSGMSIALQCGIWDRLLRLSPAFFRRFSVGDLWLRTTGVDRIRRQLTLGALTGIFTGIASLFNIALMFYYSVPLGAIACVAGLFILMATAAAARKLYRLESAGQKLEGFLSGFVVQIVKSVEKLQVAGAERRAFTRWGVAYAGKRNIALETRRLRDHIHLLNTAVPWAATALTLAWIVRGSGAPVIPIGTYLAFAASFGTFMAGMTNLSEIVVGLDVVTSWQRTKPILQEVPELRKNKSDPGRLSGRIEFQRVNFRYGAGPLTLENINIRVEPGECVALVGPSGSGKSTVLNLLLQFEVPTSGAIYIDGQDLSSLDISAVRRQFGVVNQDSKLISESIFENIVCGSLCTLNDAWEAARTAAIADDIEAMPMGMHTIVSEGGTNLSGGQRQRLLIARALVKKPAVVILDEATSALDNRTQASVTESLTRLSTTRIIVAHRLNTIRNADRIYVIEAGRVVQHGTYQELSTASGAFYELVKKQMVR